MQGFGARLCVCRSRAPVLLGAPVAGTSRTTPLRSPPCPRGSKALRPPAAKGGGVGTWSQARAAHVGSRGQWTARLGTKGAEPGWPGGTGWNRSRGPRGPGLQAASFLGLCRTSAFCLRPSVRWCPTQAWRCPLPVPHRTLLLRRKKVTSSRVEPAPARVPRALLPSCLGLSRPRPRLLATWSARPGPAQGTSPPRAAPCGWLHPASWLRQMGPSRPRRHPDASITQKRGRAQTRRGPPFPDAAGGGCGG